MFTIIATNFSNNLPWIFKLTDISKNEYYIMNADFYTKNGMNSPITKNMLDSFDIGYTIRGEVERISGFIVLTEIKK